MFTGIVEETGVVERIVRATRSIQLTVSMILYGRDLKLGDSVAVNGCCLTVVKMSSKAGRKHVQFDLLDETWKRTNLQYAKVGSKVNLERALRADSRLGGHFVTGHIDGTGKIVTWEQRGKDWFLQVEASPDILRYMIFKGAIALDGISLTVAAVQKRNFSIWIIPHTYEVTALRERKLGDAVNLEADMLAKYAEQFVRPKSRR